MILVTGGTGLVGSHLLYDLACAGKKVRALKRKDSKVSQVEKLFSYYSPNAKELLSHIEWIDGDITDIHSLLEAMEGIEQMYHCAALVSFLPDDYQRLMKINAEGTANVVNAALERKITKLCYVSSIAALGRAEHTDIVTENAMWKTSKENSGYAISKYTAECEVWRASEEGLNVVMVNPSVIIGPADWTLGSSKMFSVGHKGLKWYSSGATGFVDVRDVSGAMKQLMESNVVNERFILNSENLSFREFFNMVADGFQKPHPSREATPFLAGLGWRMEKIRSLLLGKDPVITKETARSANITYRFSSDKIRKTLKFEFIPIRQAVQDTCRAFLSGN